MGNKDIGVSYSRGIGMIQWIQRNRRAALCAAAVALALLLALLLPAIASGAGGAPSQNCITARYDPQTQSLTVAQTILYRNQQSVPLEEINLHVYPNAYQSEEIAPFERRDWTSAYPNGFSPGFMEMRSLHVEGKERLERPEGTILSIPLTSALKPGRTVRIEAEYTVQLPDSRGRFGYGEDTVNLLNAFLTPAMFDQEGWHLDAYCAVGDPFYSETMEYAVALSAPEGYALASTGVVKSQRIKDGAATWKIEAPRVRDFAAVLSTSFVSQETQVDGVRVVSHAFTQEDAALALGIASQAVATFQQRFGPCPYPEVEVCAADFFIGGMECPGLAVVDKTLYRQRRDGFLEFCIAHEVAHQWFYGGVGSDQVQEPWLDESLTEYATLIYYEDWQGEPGFQQAYKQYIKPYLYLKGLESEPIEQPITAFDSSYRYSAVIYAKGAAMWHALRGEMGDEAFFECLSTYYQRYLHRTAHKEALLECFPKEAQDFLRAWLSGEAP